ncbi:hypothetical protein D3C71_888290 [compost metagenome]
MIEVAAAAVHQTGDQRFSWWPGARHGATERAGTVVQINGFVTVLFDQSLHVPGDGIKGLFPADFLELTLTAFAHAFHWIFEAIRVVNATAHRTTTQAGANLM